MVLTSRTREREERKKKTMEEGREKERGVKRREKERGKAGGPQAYASATRIERILTPILRLVSSLASLSFFHKAFRHACKFLKPDTFPCGTFER